jgi:hypothetical protein
MDVTSVVARRAIELVSSGIDPNKAADLACREYLSMAGLGDDFIDTVETDVKAIGTEVSPYLWILSVAGFIFGVMNKAEISRMYGSWKRAKRKLLG